MIIGILVLILLAILFPGFIRGLLLLVAGVMLIGSLSVAVDFQRWEKEQAKKEQQTKELEWK